MTTSRTRRSRIIALVFLILNALSIAAAFWLLARTEPTEAKARALREESPPAEVLAVMQEALASHPFGDLLVPYEHDAIARYVSDPEALANEKGSYPTSAMRVFYIVLGEMTLLVAGMYLLGLIGAALALSGKPGLTITGAVLMLLAAPVPIVSVGPESAILTSYLLLGGILLLVFGPRAQLDLSPDDRAKLRSEGRNTMLVGVLGLVLGTAGLALALSARASPKLWIAIVACLGGGFVALIWGLVVLLRARR